MMSFGKRGLVRLFARELTMLAQCLRVRVQRRYAQGLCRDGCRAACSRRPERSVAVTRYRCLPNADVFHELTDRYWEAAALDDWGDELDTYMSDQVAALAASSFPEVPHTAAKRVLRTVRHCTRMRAGTAYAEASGLGSTRG
jgi:hypothetical protein